MRRTRVDLGQKTSSKREEDTLARKRQRWTARNRDRPPHENPFLEAIRPKHENFGDPNEKEDELRKRLANLEFGNFPGYFNYRQKAVVEKETKTDENDDSQKQQDGDKSVKDQANDKKEAKSRTEPNPLEAGLSDERLSFFKKEWFEGKQVLDIGCNRGHITYAIARLFDPKSIVGIDIDLKMIQMANRDIHLHLEGSGGIMAQASETRLKRAAELRLREASKGYDEEHCHFPLSSYISHGPLSISSEDLEPICPPTTATTSLASVGPTNSDDRHSVDSQPGDKSASATTEGNRETESGARTNGEAKGNKHYPESSIEAGGEALSGELLRFRFPNNIVFVEHNYVLARDDLVGKQRAFFDTIVCLSVTKWIHLNYCDAGLKRFFKRIYNHLKPNGLFLLEAQPFDNYGRRKKLSDRLKANYYSIQFKPEEFDSYLLGSEVGFRQVIYETSGADHLCAGFKRPLKVFLK